MDNGNGLDVQGLDDVERVLGEMAPREAFNLTRSTVHVVAGEIAKDARRDMPVDEGDLKAGTKHKRERPRGDSVESTVRSREFYWRFLEYGDGPDGEEHAMFGKAVNKFAANRETILTQLFVKKLEQRLARLARQQGG